MADIKPVTVTPKAPVPEVKKKLVAPTSNQASLLPVTGKPVDASNNSNMWFQTTCLNRSDFF